jgi:hypothetical protein
MVTTNAYVTCGKLSFPKNNDFLAILLWYSMYVKQHFSSRFCSRMILHFLVASLMVRLNDIPGVITG